MKPNTIDWSASPDERAAAAPASEAPPTPLGGTQAAAYCMTCRGEMAPTDGRPGWWTCPLCKHDKPEGMTFALPPAKLTARKASGPKAAAAARAPRPSGPLAAVRPWTEAPRTNGRLPVVAINTYAGSLLLGAKAAGLDVAGSYEDSGFGSKWQRANFPELEGFIAADRKQWPSARLDGAVVIAHPPCAAFSVQAKGSLAKAGNADKHGLASEHFKCTVEVAHYALGLGAEALLVESVQPALEGAREVHDALAEQHGYRVFRVLQNAATFGLPQWRPRFWVVFAKKDYAPRMAFVHEPNCVTVKNFLAQAEPGEPSAADASWFEQQRAFLLEKVGDAAKVDEALRTPGRLPTVLKHLLNDPRPDKVLSADYCFGCPTRTGQKKGPKTCSWMSEVLRTLDPDGLTPVLMHNSWWASEGRTLTPGEYKRAMGFPPSYELDHDFRMWLSKGVCPPVAAWLLRQVYAYVERYPEGSVPLSGVRWCEDGGTVDVQVSRDEWRVLAGVEEAGTPASEAAADDALRGPKTTAATTVTGADGRKKRRVSGRYLIESAEPLTEDAIRAAFAPHRTPVVEPLAAIVTINGRLAEVELQYEPPNAGGHAGDVDRIADRGARKLGGGWRRK